MGRLTELLARVRGEPKHRREGGFAWTSGAPHPRSRGWRGATVSRAQAARREDTERARPSEETASDAVPSGGESPWVPAGREELLARLAAKGGSPRRPFWLICKQENAQTRVFTINPGTARETLPIFGHEVEAEMFLLFGKPGVAWRARETSAEELVALLCGPCANVGKVALDPLPLFGDEAMAGLVSLPRRVFVRDLMVQGRLRMPCVGG